MFKFGVFSATLRKVCWNKFIFIHTYIRFLIKYICSLIHIYSYVTLICKNVPHDELKKFLDHFYKHRYHFNEKSFTKIRRIFFRCIGVQFHCDFFYRPFQFFLCSLTKCGMEKNSRAWTNTQKQIVIILLSFFKEKKIVLNKHKKPWALKWLGCICGYTCISWSCKIYRASYMCNGWNIVACIKDIYFKIHNCFMALLWQKRKTTQRGSLPNVYQITFSYLNIRYGLSFFEDCRMYRM